MVKSVGGEYNVMKGYDLHNIALQLIDTCIYIFLHLHFLSMCIDLTSITSWSLLHEIEALQIYTCVDRVYVIDCNE